MVVVVFGRVDVGLFIAFFCVFVYVCRYKETFKFYCAFGYFDYIWCVCRENGFGSVWFDGI